MNGPKLWADMLAAINIPGAVIAGGCIRDCFLNVAHKDIDIFIPCEGNDEFRRRIDKLNLCAMGSLDRIEDEDYEADDSVGHLFGVAEGEILGQQVNLIARRVHLDGAQALIESFDFGILQVYYDGESCKFTPAQRADAYLQRATMAHDRHIEQSLERFYRFNARNPGLLSLNVPFVYPAVPGVVEADNEFVF